MKAKRFFFKPVILISLGLALSLFIGQKSVSAEIMNSLFNYQQDQIEKSALFSIDDIENIKVLDLETAKQLAVRNNPSVLLMNERIVQAEEQIAQAIGSVLPSLDLSSSQTRQSYSTNSGLSDPDDVYATGLSISMNLFSGFSSQYAMEYAETNRQSVVESEKDARRQLIYSVAQSYYSAQFAKENMAILQETIDYNKRLLKEAEFKKEIGRGSLSDTYNFKIQVNSAENELITAHSDYKITMTGLAALLGIPGASFPADLKLDELNLKEVIEVGSYDIHVLYEKARLNRPDLKQLDYSISQADTNIDLSKSEYYPTIDLSHSINSSRTGGFGFAEDDLENVTKLSLSFNIFSGGKTKSKINEAKSVKREAEMTLKNAEISLKSDLNSALSLLKSAETKLKLQRASTELVKLNRDLIEKEYKVGKKSLISLNEAQNSLVTSQGELASAIVSLKTSIEKVNAYTGDNLKLKQD